VCLSQLWEGKFLSFFTLAGVFWFTLLPRTVVVLSASFGPGLRRVSIAGYRGLLAAPSSSSLMAASRSSVQKSPGRIGYPGDSSISHVASLFFFS
jgi:hypothetical protein